MTFRIPSNAGFSSQLEIGCIACLQKRDEKWDPFVIIDCDKYVLSVIAPHIKIDASGNVMFGEDRTCQKFIPVKKECDCEDDCNCDIDTEIMISYEKSFTEVGKDYEYNLIELDITDHYKLNLLPDISIIALENLDDVIQRPKCMTS